MTLAFWMILVAALLPYIGTGYAKFAEGGARTYDNHAPRDGLETLPLRRRRAYWAQLNGFEAFPAFAAGVIVAQLAGASQVWIDTLASTFVALRFIYTLLYIHDQATARSIVWAAGLACVVGLYVSAAVA
ncbi:MAG TPA: MAPEG family protein [Burkholderiales bacterium]|nr:MAPEG family protein [Burkholderiales bacterium]